MEKLNNIRMGAGRRAAALLGAFTLLLAGTTAQSIARTETFGPLSAPSPLVAPHAPAAPAGLDLNSADETTTGNSAIVYNGEAITYTFTLTNPGPVLATNVIVYDSMPPDTFDQITCLGSVPCARQIVTTYIANPLGGFIEVTRTSLLSWTIPSLAVNNVISVSFRARVLGKSEGASFTNNVFVAYDQGSPFQGVLLQTTVQQRVPGNGQAGLPNAPTWFSSDSGGTLSQAWGDYAREGVLDLALASSVGTTIYHNDHGTLKAVMNNTTQSYGVAWGDVDGDGYLELIAVGDSADKTAITQGINYVYHYSPATGKFTLFSTFNSPLQFARIAAADLTGSGKVDLIASTNAINAAHLNGSCAVYVYHNDGSGTFQDISKWQCISRTATAAIGLGDFRNTGKPDLVLGQFPNGLVWYNNASVYYPQITNTVNSTVSFPLSSTIDPGITFLPYGFSVGDFNQDGFLDLAAAYPLQREARVYANLGGHGFALSTTIRTNVFWTPLSVEWGDFTGDGRQDLLVADSPVKIYHYKPSQGAFTLLGQLAQGAVTGQVWDLRAVQTHPYQDLALSLTDRDQASMIFDGIGPHLSHHLTLIDPPGNPVAAGSVALGVSQAGGMMDILYGSAGGTLGSRLYLNNGSGFPTFESPNPSSVLGPEKVAFGDINKDGKLEIAIGSSVDVRIYSVYDASQSPQIISLPAGGPYTVAWGDINGDGLLDLLVGSNGPVYAFLNVNGQIQSAPVWVSGETCKTTSVAWADYNRSNWLSFAAGCDGAPTRIYRNNGTNSFALAWASPYYSHTTSVAWADYDASGYPSLAVGNKGDHTLLFQNISGTLSSTPVWSTPTMSQTTAIAWGDWNNDGYPELALGNQNEAVQVFSNMTSKPGQPRLAWVWSSYAISNVSGLAWGDVTNNGYNSLVVASADPFGNGYYANGSALPAQFTSNYTPSLPLPLIAPYVTITRPGTTRGAFLYSSSELLGSLRAPTVTVQYKVYGADASRDLSKSVQISTSVPISRMMFEYSLDDGANWLAATPDISSPLPLTSAVRTGTPGIFIWNPVADKAISDNARFRVTAVKADNAGPVHRTIGSAVTPPFRVRATTCDWPAAPFFTYAPTNPLTSNVVHFYGAIGGGSGQMTVTWNFGDGSSPALGQNAVHSYTAFTTMTLQVNMTVYGQNCPITRPVYTTTLITINNPAPPKAQVFLPMVLAGSGRILLRPAGESAPGQIADLTGDTTSVAGGTHLSWSPPPGTVSGYNVYRQAIGTAGAFDLLAALPAAATSYDDMSAVCGQAYYVTALNVHGESAPSTSSYYSVPCEK